MATNQALVEAIYQILAGGAVPGTAARGAGALGWRVDRDAAADPQNVWQNLFTIAGGIIAVTSLIGVRTIIQANGASTMQFRHSVGPTVLDNGTAVITADAVNTLYIHNGDGGDSIQVGVAGVGVSMAKNVAISAQYGSFPLAVLMAGTIAVTMTAGAGTGSTRYILTYIPLGDAVTVVAV
jgi:hypothetical protein